MKDLENAQSAEHKAEKEYVSAVKDHEKAVAEEHKLKEKLNQAIHKHEEAVSHEQKELKDSESRHFCCRFVAPSLTPELPFCFAVQLKEQHKANLAQDVASKKQLVEQLKQKHEVGSAQREERIADLQASKEQKNAPVAAAAVPGTATAAPTTTAAPATTGAGFNNNTASAVPQQQQYGATGGSSAYPTIGADTTHTGAGASAGGVGGAPVIQSGAPTSEFNTMHSSGLTTDQRLAGNYGNNTANTGTY